MHMSVFPTVSAPSEIRQRLIALADSVSAESLEDLRTLASELVAASVVNGARRPIDLRFDFIDSEIEGVVCDDGAAPRALLRAAERLDDSLAATVIRNLTGGRWGVDTDEAKVWFRIPVERVE
jgi:anti-sigma regulatory factor (Ser/Thr protein kinase)